GHQVVGEVVATGSGVARFRAGDRVGIAWLGWACGTCGFCARGRENLCAQARFTGFTLDGGFAELAVVAERFAFALPTYDTDPHTAPLLCAGLIGYRALRFAGDAERIGLYGFGASAHLVAQVAHWQGRRVFAFTRRGDEETARFARSLGVAWTGASGDEPPEPLDAALIFAPVGPLVPAALRATDRAGVVVCAGIHMSDIPSFPYEELYEERVLRSVANLTRQDGEEFLAVAPSVPVRTEVTEYPLERANDALEDLRAGRFRGAAVVVPPRPAA
ncbi:MAG: alcohol dehydrogenase, propanol-preferring, partial [Solirubrobacteraceae bacterium]|nr:alcohol dehydrogenase, propanol-preferring [Solirubrobacteraceae bacterium]